MKELQWVQIIDGEVVTEMSLRNKRAQDYINMVAERRQRMLCEVIGNTTFVAILLMIIVVILY